MECENASFEAYEFMLSKTYSAYDETAFLVEEPPKLKWKTRDINFKTNKDYCISFVNIGGKFSGVSITFDFNENINDLDLCEAHISRFDGHTFLGQEIQFKKENGLFKADIDFLNIGKGVNPYSAVLRGKKRANEEERYGFRLGVLPVSKDNIVLKGILTITSNGVEIFKGNI